MLKEQSFIGLKGVVNLKLKAREEIPVEHTWDLAVLYPNNQKWEQELHEIEQLVEKIIAYQGKITTSARNLYETLTLMDQLSLKLEWTGSYARMTFDVNMSDSQAKSNYEKIDQMYTKTSDLLAFYEPELLKLSPNTFDIYKQEVPQLTTYDFMFEKLFKEKEHILSQEQEEILARMSSLGASFKKIYDDITVNDLSFPEIEGPEGESILANETNYRRILSSDNRDLRKRYFKGLLGTYGSHINSFTSIILGNIKYEMYLAKTRKYPSSRHMSLQQNHIPVSVYDTLIQTVRENVHLLQQYFSLRQKVLDYQDLHFYDLFVPLVKNIEKSYTFEEARDIVLEALGILGTDYQNTLLSAFKERWIDVYPNKGKVSGAYANGIYGHHPYSLLNFTGTIDDIFTMAHELGHVMHSYYSNKHQPYVNSHYVIFTAEVASTVNEYLLYHYLLNKIQSEHERAYLLNMHLDSIRSTLYRQTFFADFEMKVHQIVSAETPLTPEQICLSYQDLYAYYHGAGFTIDQELTYEWSRIPHFYNPFYVYQYATGISAAIHLAKSIINKKPQAKERYLNFLTQGGSNYPIVLLEEAGVNMSTSTPIIAALQDFSETLTNLKHSI